MGLNVARARSVLRDLHGHDPNAHARQQLIPAFPQSNPTGLQASALMAAELLRDPHTLVTGRPPAWLADLTETGRGGAILLFDSRLSDLSRRIVDDVVAQGVSVEELVGWLRARAREERAARAAPGHR